MPWKTREWGLCLRFGIGGEADMVNQLDGTPMYSYKRMYEEADRDLVLDVAEKVVGKWSRTAEDASPGWWSAEEATRAHWKAVRDIVREDTCGSCSGPACVVGWEQPWIMAPL